MVDSKELGGHFDGLLQRMSLTLDRQKEAYADELGIPRQQFDVLSIIYDRDLITMGELCKEISSACSTATDIADKLERAGYAERLREKRDRRVVRLHILPEGEKLVKAIREKRVKGIEALLGSFPMEELTINLSFLEAFVDKLERVEKNRAVSQD